MSWMRKQKRGDLEEVRKKKSSLMSWMHLHVIVHHWMRRRKLNSWMKWTRRQKRGLKKEMRKKRNVFMSLMHSHLRTSPFHRNSIPPSTTPIPSAPPLSPSFFHHPSIPSSTRPPSPPVGELRRTEGKGKAHTQ